VRALETQSLAYHKKIPLKVIRNSLSPDATPIFSGTIPEGGSIEKRRSSRGIVKGFPARVSKAKGQTPTIFIR